MTSIYIDTNVFLDFYQAAHDRMGVFKELHERGDCIIVPEQTVKEFRRNRAARLIELAKQLEKSTTINIHTTAIVRELPEFEKLQATRDEAKKHIESMVLQLRLWAHNEPSDPVYQEFVKLYCHGTTMSTPDDALVKAQERKLIGDPPTSPGKHTVGDEIIWETILACCPGDLIVVSRDRTFLDNESLLRTEFESSGKRRLLAVTDKLGTALEMVGRRSDSIEEAEKEVLNQDAYSREAIKSGVCPSCRVEMDEQGFEGSDGDMAWWLSCPKCNRNAFPRS